MRVIPGDPFGEEQGLPTEIYQSLKEHYGLNKPLFEEYARYLSSIVRLDLGHSLVYKDRSVNDIIIHYFPVSALLGLEALLFSLSVGLTLGVIAAYKENGWQDHLAMFLTTLGISVPSFILAALLQYYFAIKWDLLPLARWESFSHTILPVLALSALPTTFIARLMRTSMIEVLKTDYIKTAQSKGLSWSYILFKHGIRNALLPILTYLGPLIANILVGSFVVEKIFSIPGLGQWFVNSVNNRDYPVIMGLTIFYSVILSCSVMLVEISYCALDPRIKKNHT